MEHLKLVMDKGGFPDEAKPPILSAARIVLTDKNCAIATAKLGAGKWDDINKDIVEPVIASAKEHGVNEYTYIMAFYLLATELLLERYRTENIAEENFWSVIVDFRCKLIECHDNYGVWGTTTLTWHAPFFSLYRMALGRFQYDNAVFQYSSYTKRGYTIKKGDPCVQFHIPSSGPLVEADRLDSYRRAYEFYCGRFNGVVPIACGSWLLYPGHEEFLPPTSNLLSFMHDFDFLVGGESEPGKFDNQWRVFGRQYDNTPPETWPQDTSLRRAYAKRMAEGGRSGRGYGALFYPKDGIGR